MDENSGPSVINKPEDDSVAKVSEGAVAEPETKDQSSAGRAVTIETLIAEGDDQSSSEGGNGGLPDREYGGGEDSSPAGDSDDDDDDDSVGLSYDSDRPDDSPDSIDYSSDDDSANSFDYNDDYDDGNDIFPGTSDTSYSSDLDSDEYDFSTYIKSPGRYQEEMTWNLVVWEKDHVPTEEDKDKLSKTKEEMLKFLKSKNPMINRSNYDAFNSRVAVRVLMNFVTRNEDPFPPEGEDGPTIPQDIMSFENVRIFFDHSDNRTDSIAQPKITEDLFYDFGFDVKNLSYQSIKDEESRNSFLSYKVTKMFENSSRIMKQFVGENFVEILDGLFNIFRGDSRGNFYHFSIIFQALLKNSPKTLIRLLGEDEYLKFKVLIRYLTIQPISKCITEIFNNYSAKDDSYLNMKSNKSSIEKKMENDWESYFVDLLSNDEFVFSKEIFGCLLVFNTRKEFSLFEYFVKNLIDKIAIIPKGMEILDPFLQNEREFGDFVENVVKSGNDTGRVSAFINILHYIINKSQSEVFDYSDIYSGPAEVENSISPAFSLILETLFYKIDSMIHVYLEEKDDALLRSGLLDILVNLFDYFILTNQDIEREMREGGDEDSIQSMAEIREIWRSIEIFFDKLIEQGFVSSLIEDYLYDKTDGRNHYLREAFMRFFHVSIVLRNEKLFRFLLGDEMIHLKRIVELYRQDRDSPNYVYFGNMWLILNLVRLALQDETKFASMRQEVEEQIGDWAEVSEMIMKDTEGVIPKKFDGEDVSEQLSIVRRKYQDIQDRKKEKLNNISRNGGIFRFMSSIYNQDDEDNEAESILSLQMNILESELEKDNKKSREIQETFGGSVKPFYISVNEKMNLDYFDPGVGLGSSFARRLGF